MDCWVHPKALIRWRESNVQHDTSFKVKTIHLPASETGDSNISPSNLFRSPAAPADDLNHVKNEPSLPTEISKFSIITDSINVK